MTLEHILKAQVNYDTGTHFESSS